MKQVWPLSPKHNPKLGGSFTRHYVTLIYVFVAHLVSIIGSSNVGHGPGSQLTLIGFLVQLATFLANTLQVRAIETAIVGVTFQLVHAQCI